MNPRIAKLFSGIGLFSLLCALPSTTEAVYAGVKSMGRGGAVMAKPVDSFIIAYNPGGLSWVKEQLNVGGYWINQKGHTEISGNLFENGKFTTNKNPNMFLPEIGACMNYCQCNWTVGIVGYTRSYIKTDYKVPIAAFGTSRLGLEYELETISPAGSIKFGRYHSLGISLDLMTQRLKVNGLENFANRIFSHDPSKVTNKGYDYSFGVGCTVGWVSEFWRCAKIGLAWSPPVVMSNFNKYKGLLARRGQLHIPQRYMIGLAFDIAKNLIVEIDAEHAGWNNVPSLAHSISELDDDVPFGDRDGVGLGWRDQLIWRIGAEYFAEWYSLRIGYQQARIPIRRSQNFFNALTPNIIEYWVTGGLTAATPCWGEITLYGAYGFKNFVDGRGTTRDRHHRRRHNIPLELGGGVIDLNDMQYNAGLSWTKYY